MYESNLRSFRVDALDVHVFADQKALAQAASYFVFSRLEATIELYGKANLLLATGNSQIEFLKVLKNENLDWSKVTVFHLDEYIGIPEDHPASFRRYLREKLLNDIKPERTYYLDADSESVELEIMRFESILRAHPIDVACIGIGENGHIAFNDPPYANFEDPDMLKIVELDETSRQQQVNEGWFEKLDDVPTKALTMTIPTIIDAKSISCVAPEQRKADAVHKALTGPISEDCPASVLRTHLDAVLFLDQESAGMVQE